MSDGSNFTSPVAQTVEAAKDLVTTPIQANVTPLLVCFFIMAAALCGFLYLQISLNRGAIENVVTQLSDINKNLTKIEAELDGLDLNRRN